MKQLGIVMAVIALAIAACSGGDNDSVAESTKPTVATDPTTEKNNNSDSTEVSKGTLSVSFDYKHYPTLATGQYAVWIEDAQGNLVKTLYVTRFTGEGGYKRRPDSCPTWVSKANPDEMSSDDLDAVTGATPSNGRQTYTWDGTNAHGSRVANGKYTINIEGTLYWSSRVMYTGSFVLGGNHQTVKMSQTNSSDDETNRDMIVGLRVEYNFNK